MFVIFVTNISFMDYASGIRLPDSSKLAVNWKNGNDIAIMRHDVIINIFDVVLFLLSSLVTGPTFMLISSLVLELWQFPFIRDWPEIRKSEIPPSENRKYPRPKIGNTPVWVFPNIWRLGWVRNTKFGTKVSNEMLLNAAKCQGYSFYHFWVIKAKQTGRGKITPPSTHPHTQRLGLTQFQFLI